MGVLQHASGPMQVIWDGVGEPEGVRPSQEGLRAGSTKTEAPCGVPLSTSHPPPPHGPARATHPSSGTAPHSSRRRGALLSSWCSPSSRSRRPSSPGPPPASPRAAAPARAAAAPWLRPEPRARARVGPLACPPVGPSVDQSAGGSASPPPHPPAPPRCHRPLLPPARPHLTRRSPPSAPAPDGRAGVPRPMGDGTEVKVEGGGARGRGQLPARKWGGPRRVTPGRGGARRGVGRRGGVPSHPRRNRVLSRPQLPAPAGEGRRLS